jgi:hypothetical protein
VEEMEDFLAKYKLLKLSHKDVENPVSFQKELEKLLKIYHSKSTKMRWFLG